MNIFRNWLAGTTLAIAGMVGSWAEAQQPPPPLLLSWVVHLKWQSTLVVAHKGSNVNVDHVTLVSSLGLGMNGAKPIGEQVTEPTPGVTIAPRTSEQTQAGAMRLRATTKVENVLSQPAPSWLNAPPKVEIAVKPPIIAAPVAPNWEADIANGATDGPVSPDQHAPLTLLNRQEIQIQVEPGIQNFDMNWLQQSLQHLNDTQNRTLYGGQPVMKATVLKEVTKPTRALLVAVSRGNAPDRNPMIYRLYMGTNGASPAGLLADNPRLQPRFQAQNP